MATIEPPQRPRGRQGIPRPGAPTNIKELRIGDYVLYLHPDGSVTWKEEKTGLPGFRKYGW